METHIVVQAFVGAPPFVGEHPHGERVAAVVVLGDLVHLHSNDQVAVVVELVVSVRARNLHAVASMQMHHQLVLVHHLGEVDPFFTTGEETEERGIDPADLVDVPAVEAIGRVLAGHSNGDLAKDTRRHGQAARLQAVVRAHVRRAPHVLGRPSTGVLGIGIHEDGP